MKFRPQLGGPANETSVSSTRRSSSIPCADRSSAPPGSSAATFRRNGCRVAEVALHELGLRAEHQAAPEHGLRERADLRARAGRATVPASHQSDLLFAPGDLHDLSGSRRAFNPGALQPFLIGTILTSAGGSPAYVTDKLPEVWGHSVAIQTIGGETVAAGDSDSGSSIKPGLIPRERATENASARSFPMATSRRRPPVPVEPVGEIRNGNGNDSECGDVNRTFRVGQQDRSAIASFLIGNPPAGFDATCATHPVPPASPTRPAGRGRRLEQDKNFQESRRGSRGMRCVHGAHGWARSREGAGPVPMLAAARAPPAQSLPRWSATAPRRRTAAVVPSGTIQTGTAPTIDLAELGQAQPTAAPRNLSTASASRPDPRRGRHVHRAGERGKRFGRITGGTPSDINGTVRSTIDGANVPCSIRSASCSDPTHSSTCGGRSPRAAPTRCASARRGLHHRSSRRERRAVVGRGSGRVRLHARHAGFDRDRPRVAGARRRPRSPFPPARRSR